MATLLKINISTLVIILLSTWHTNAQYALESYNDSIVAKQGLTEIQFVGTGDIQLAIAQGKDIAANTGLGATFWRIWPNNDEFGLKQNRYGTKKIYKGKEVTNFMAGVELQLEVQINVASTADTIVAIYNKTDNKIVNIRDFGSYVLVPVSLGRARSTAFHSIWYFKPDYYDRVTGVTNRSFLHIPYIDGFEVSGSASSQVWRLDSLTSVDVNILSWRIGFFYDFPDDRKRRINGYSIRFGLNYVGRGIRGDAGRRSSEGDIIRQTILGNESTTYHGVEPTLTLRLKNIRAEASLPIMHLGAKKSSVPGLSGTQFITSVSFVGGFPLKL